MTKTNQPALNPDHKPFRIRLPPGCSVAITPGLMGRINRAQRTRRCVECGGKIPSAWPGVTCGSRACMGRWLPGKGEVESETSQEEAI